MTHRQAIRADLAERHLADAIASLSLCGEALEAAGRLADGLRARTLAARCEALMASLGPLLATAADTLEASHAG